MSNGLRALGALAVLAATPALAFGHTGLPTDSFVHELLHLKIGLDYMLAAVAVGLLGTLLGRHARGMLRSPSSQR